MKRLGLASFCFLALAFVLVSCGKPLFNTQNLAVGINPAPLGYQADTSGTTVKITISTRILTFQSRAGALGAVVEGYTEYFYDGAGHQIGGPVKNDTLGIEVPSGIRCTDGSATSPCTANSAGAEYTDGYSVQSVPVQLLPIDVALANYTAGMPHGWTAEIQFYGTTDVGSGFLTKPLIVPIYPPVK